MTGAVSGWKLRKVRKASQQKVRAVLLIWSHWKVPLMGSLPPSALAFFTEVDKVGRREAPSLSAIFQWSVSLSLVDWRTGFFSGRFHRQTGSWHPSLGCCNYLPCRTGWIDWNANCKSRIQIGPVQTLLKPDLQSRTLNALECAVGGCRKVVSCDAQNLIPIQRAFC